MATTTKSRAKTKSSKKSATKAAKTTKKTVSTGVSKAAKAKKPAVSSLHRLNMLSGILGVLLAVAAGFFMNSTAYQLFTGYLTSDELLSTTGTVFVPAIHVMFDLELRWAVVGIMLISAVIPLMAATRNRKQYEASLAKKVMAWRWIDVAIVSALMVEVIALLSGVQDIMTLKLIGGLMVVTGLLGWFSEKHSANNSKPASRYFNLSLFTGFLPWLVIAVYAGGTIMHGMVRSPWYVYALYGTTLLAFIGYAMNERRLLKARQSYEVTERNYLSLGIFAKVAFAVILIIGLYKG